MTDKKLTDSEIVKALECCCNDDIADKQNLTECYSCPLASDKECTYTLRKHALDLINRLQAEVERLKKALKVQGERLVCEREQKYEQIDIITKLKDQLVVAKAEAYKECIEKVKDIDQCTFDGWIEFPEDRLNNLLNELVGEDNV